MNDRLLFRSTWLTVMALIGLAGCAGVVCFQMGVLTLMNAEFSAGFIQLGIAGVLITGAYVLCRYRDDLIDDGVTGRCRD